MKKRKKMKLWTKVLIFAALAAVSILLAVYIQIFVIGNTADVMSIFACNVEYNTDKIRIIVDQTSSATGIVGCKARKKGDSVYIKIRETLVDGVHQYNGSAKLELVGDFADVKNIYLEDGINKKQIYPHDYGKTIEQTLEECTWIGGEWETIEVKD
ncbi:MAG: hypothetical protein IJR59_03670 [Firmicutes bacterium]|nr:hypothetical protein [Bacillota bacterium]